MESLYLVVRIAGQSVAIAAQQVGSVVEVEQIGPVPCVPPHIAGLFALRSRVLTVIDSQAALGHEPMRRDALHTAVIVTSDGHGYALLVDEVLDVVTAVATPCSALLGAGWQRVTSGQIAGSDGTLLLVEPARLIAGPAIAQAA